MIVLSVLLALAAAVLLAPTVSDLISLGVAAFRGREVVGTANGAPAAPAPQRFLFLVPAHNEALLIGPCVRSLLAVDYPLQCCSVVVIADNCTDGTTALARGAGARCFERTDPLHPGKPRAIAWALERVALRDYDAVVIVDADTVVSPDFASRLNALGPLRHSAAQAFFDLSNPAESSITRMSAVLATATHRFSYPLKRRAGLNAPLVGNGMVIGTGVLARHGWHAFSICEDWEMYALLTARGVSIAPATGARLHAQEARSLRQSSSQRQRWTAGKLTVVARVGPALLASRTVPLRQKLDALAELASPGPGLHLGLVLLLGIAAALLHPPAAPLLVAALAASLIRPAAYTVAALVVDPDPARAILAFAFLPIYAVWRIGTAVLALRAVGDAPWVRTQRHKQMGA